jgi:hypothetical protein
MFNPERNKPGIIIGLEECTKDGQRHRSLFPLKIPFEK